MYLITILGRPSGSTCYLFLVVSQCLTLLCHLSPLENHIYKKSAEMSVTFRLKSIVIPMDEDMYPPTQRGETFEHSGAGLSEAPVYNDPTSHATFELGQLSTEQQNDPYKPLGADDGEGLANKDYFVPPPAVPVEAPSSLGNPEPPVDPNNAVDDPSFATQSDMNVGSAESEPLQQLGLGPLTCSPPAIDLVLLPMSPHVLQIFVPNTSYEQGNLTQDTGRKQGDLMQLAASISPAVRLPLGARVCLCRCPVSPDYHIRRKLEKASRYPNTKSTPKFFASKTKDPVEATVWVEIPKEGAFSELTFSIPAGSSKKNAKKADMYRLVLMVAFTDKNGIFQTFPIALSHIRSFVVHSSANASHNYQLELLECLPSSVADDTALITDFAQFLLEQSEFHDHRSKLTSDTGISSDTSLRDMQTLQNALRLKAPSAENNRYIQCPQLPIVREFARSFPQHSAILEGQQPPLIVLPLPNQSSNDATTRMAAENRAHATHQHFVVPQSTVDSESFTTSTDNLRFGYSDPTADPTHHPTAFDMSETPQRPVFPNHHCTDVEANFYYEEMPNAEDGPFQAELLDAPAQPDCALGSADVQILMQASPSLDPPVLLYTYTPQLNYRKSEEEEEEEEEEEKAHQQQQEEDALEALNETDGSTTNASPSYDQSIEHLEYYSFLG